MGHGGQERRFQAVSGFRAVLCNGKVIQRDAELILGPRPLFDLALQLCVRFLQRQRPLLDEFLQVLFIFEQLLLRLLAAGYLDAASDNERCSSDIDPSARKEKIALAFPGLDPRFRLGFSCRKRLLMDCITALLSSS